MASFFTGLFFGICLGGLIVATNPDAVAQFEFKAESLFKNDSEEQFGI